MADLTPELLAQLEADAAGWCKDAPFAAGADAAAEYAAADFRQIDEDGSPISFDREGDEIDPFNVYHRNDDGSFSLAIQTHFDDMDEFIARSLNALPALVAAARERDQLQVKLENQGHALFVAEIEHKKMQAEVSALRAEVERLESRQQVHLQQIAKLSQSTPLAEELTGWEGQRAKMMAEIGTLRGELARLRAPVPPISEDAERVVGEMMAEARRTPTTQETPVRRMTVKLAAVDRLEEEVKRLRRAAGECLTLLEALDDGETWSRSGAAMHLARLRAEIERKP